MLEEKIIDQTEQLQLQKEKENKIHNEVSDLKQQIEVLNNTILNLQEEGKTNNILVPQLQNRIDVSQNMIFILFYSFCQIHICINIFNKLINYKMTRTTYYSLLLGIEYRFN